LHCRGILAFFLNLKGKTLKSHDNANLKGKTLKSHDNANLKGKTQIIFAFLAHLTQRVR
jgi:hypothetical protein